MLTKEQIADQSLADLLVDSPPEAYSMIEYAAIQVVYSQFPHRRERSLSVIRNLIGVPSITIETVDKEEDRYVYLFFPTIDKAIYLGTFPVCHIIEETPDEEERKKYNL